MEPGLESDLPFEPEYMEPPSSSSSSAAGDLDNRDDLGDCDIRSEDDWDDEAKLKYMHSRYQPWNWRTAYNGTLDQTGQWDGIIAKKGPFTYIPVRTPDMEASRRKAGEFSSSAQLRKHISY